MELISIIVPIYKVEKYLNKCIESIVNQTYTNLEIILVDDGSPDSCPEICDDWAKKDGRIKVIHKENGGLSDARNVGLGIATGEYISFVDSDDFLEPEFLEKLYKMIIDYKADISACGVRIVSESGEKLRERSCGQETLELNKIDALRRLVLEDGIYQTVWNKLYKRSVVDGIPFEFGKCNEDDFWTYQVIDKAEKIVATSCPLYNYLQRNESIMGSGFSVKRLDGLEARFRRMQHLQKYEELADFTKEQLYGDCLYMYQSAVRCLEGQERKKVTEYVMKDLKLLPPILKSKSISIKYKIWFIMFKIAPYVTVKIRNLLRIGL